MVTIKHGCKKKICASFLSFSTVFFLLAFILLPLSSFPQVSSVKVYVNGIELPVQAFIKGGIAYLPAQVLAYHLKVKLQWNAVTRQLKVNNVLINAPSMFKDGALYAPVEALVHVIGANLEWEGESRAIYIRYTANLPAPGGPDTQPIFPITNPGINSPINEKIPEPETFIPKTIANSDYSVTVTNVNEVKIIKEYYRPKPGYKFVIVHVSQQNISNKVQLYTGRFVLQDHQDQTYEYIEGLSNFWLQILRPGGINFGSLVFEMPLSAASAKIVLHAYGSSPLALNLK